VKGRTQLEAGTDKGTQFTITCERLNLQTPDGKVEASGEVKVTGPSVEGACDKLMLSWSDERVMLQGKVRLKCQQDGREVDLTGDQLSIKLAAAEIVPPPEPEQPEAKK
jgi:hypothetical protein